VVSASDKKLEIAISDPDAVPDIVSSLVKAGARIKSVHLQKEDIENVFLRLYNERT
jgi:hypothetical protein